MTINIDTDNEDNILNSKTTFSIVDDHRYEVTHHTVNEKTGCIDVFIKETGVKINVSLNKNFEL